MANTLGVGWTAGHELAALTAEVCHAIYRATLAVGGVRKGRLPSPLRIPRPGPTNDKPAPAPRRAASVDEVLATLAAGHRQ